MCTPTPESASLTGFSPGGRVGRKMFNLQASSALSRTREGEMSRRARQSCREESEYGSVLSGLEPAPMLKIFNIIGVIFQE